MEPGESYLKAVRKQLNGPREEKKRFLCGLQGDLEGFLELNPDAVYCDIETNFGNPKELAQEFAGSLEPQFLERFLRMRRKLFLFMGTVAIAAALIIVGFLVKDYLEWKHFSNGYCTETIVVSPDSEILPERPEESTDTILVYR